MADSARAPQIIGYVRVSTKEQSISGLGLEAQRECIARYVAAVGGRLLKTYVEVESGKNSQRPEIAVAIAHAKRVRAKLVIAKLDRLARSVHFITGLIESRVDFASCENPDANVLETQLRAMIAEEEGRKISERTKAALSAAKQRGIKLGSARIGHWKGRERIRQAAIRKAATIAKANRDRQSDEVYPLVLPLIFQLRGEGMSLQAIANHLNGKDFTTVRGLPWNRMQVLRLLQKQA